MLVPTGDRQPYDAPVFDAQVEALKLPFELISVTLAEKITV